jgi:hypothetical protein
MRFLHSTSLLMNISFVTASHFSINSETRLTWRPMDQDQGLGSVENERRVSHR